MGSYSTTKIGSAAGFGNGGLFATLTDAPTLSASDFVVQG